MHSGHMPLAVVPEGARVTVIELAGGPEMRRRMADLGIIPGGVLRIVRSGCRGPVVVMVGGSRLALGHEVARRILVVRT